jgi:TonB-linked SusC/RagA family outer membrane protein
MKFYVRLLMRINLICLILFSALLQVSASGLAQNISISKKNITLQQLFTTIKTQTGYDFLYEPQMLYQANTVNLNVSKVPLKQVLDQVFANQPLTYTIDQKTIIIQKKELNFMDKFIKFFKNINITGRVTDEMGFPLTGATIRIKGTPRIVYTNKSGEFEFKNVDERAELIVSFIGYDPKEVRASASVEVKLHEHLSQLDSVVVVSTGYQTLNKERSTGSFSVVDNKLLNRIPNGNIIDRIADVVPGFMKTSKKEMFAVRGISTINGNKEPLIVLDDFPYPGDINSINRINPNDIESVTILKDAAAASIWGAQAGNGVVVITTKKGKFNKAPSVSFNSNITVGQKPDIYSIPTISSKDEIAFERMRFNRGDYTTYDVDYPKFNNFSTVLPPAVELLLAAKSGKITQQQAEDQIAVYEKHDVRDDINKYMMQNSVNQQYSFNISGGTSNYNYYTSVGYDKNRSTSVGQVDDRLSLNFNNNFKPVKNVEINAFVGYTRSKINNAIVYGTSFLPTGGQVAAYTMLADANGNALAIPKTLRSAYVDTAKAPGLLDWHYRPLDEMNNEDKTQKVDLLRIGGGIKYTVLPGLSAEVKYQYQSTQIANRDYKTIDNFDVRNKINNFTHYNPTTKQLEYPFPKGGTVDLSNTLSTSWNLRGTVNYNRQWGDHEIVAIAGSEIRQNTDNSNSSSVYGFDPNTYQTTTINPTIFYPTRFGSSATIGGGNFISNGIGRYGDYFTNAAYTYKNKYTVSASGRIDESNFFGVKANQRIAPLWSSGLAWNLLRESFFHADWLSQLKLRATYGYNGNTNGGTVFPTATYSNGGNNIGVPYASLTSPGNPELRWEKVKIINYAVEAASRNNRISGSLEYYTKDGIDLISSISLDPTVGVSSFVGNKATIKAHGYDFTLNTINTVGAVQWSTTFLLAYNIDKVTSYDQAVTQTSLYTSDEVPVIGQPLYKISSYRWAGLNPKDGTPQIYIGGKVSSYLDLAKAKQSDMVYSGPTVPRYAGSVINTVNYKEFSLSFNIIYRLKYVFRRSTIDYANLYSGWNGSNDYASRWQKPGDEKFTNVPALPVNGSPGDAFRSAQFYSDNLVEKGDNIRFQDIRMSYNLSKRHFRSLPFQNIQLYAYTNNLGLLWKANKSGLDPDAASFGSTPVPKTFAAGFSVNF